MPVRSLNSVVFRWPGREDALAAARSWAAALRASNPLVAAVYLIGSCARGDWGVGSDLDFIIVVQHSDLPMIRRPIGVDTSSLPVAADVQVYTRAEWERLGEDAPHVWARYQREMLNLLDAG